MMNTQQCWFAPEAGENAPSNGGGSDPAPEAKRQRVSGAGGAACGAPPQQRHHQQCQPQQQALEPAAVLGWLASCGGATGPQLCERFGCRTPAAVQQLAAVLGGLVDGFDVMRQGGDSATCAAINLADPAVRFLTL